VRRVVCHVDLERHMDVWRRGVCGMGILPEREAVDGRFRDDDLSRTGHVGMACGTIRMRSTGGFGMMTSAGQVTWAWHVALFGPGLGRTFRF